MGIVGFVFAVVVVTALVVIPFVGVWLAGMDTFFGVFIPYAAVAVFFAGLIYRVLKWGKSPVPFRIPTVAGQEKSLPWIKYNNLESPNNIGDVVMRMFLEICCFRSLFRNVKLDFREGRVTYGSSKWLWGFALVFHYAFLVVIIRHLRFFLTPVPGWLRLIESLDGFLEIGLYPVVWLPGLYLSGVVLLGAVTYLFLRRVFIPQLRYISLANDWFPLLMIIAIAKTGILMRYIFKVDIVGVKQLTMSLINLNPQPVEGIGVLFYIHLFLVSVFLAYFPFSKLMHAPGIFLSPTRNLVNNSRRVRHINPWNPKVKVHSYEAYENEFRDLMVEAGLPVDKEPTAQDEAAAEDKE